MDRSCHHNFICVTSCRALPYTQARMSQPVAKLAEELKKFDGAANDRERRAILKEMKGHIKAQAGRMSIPRLRPKKEKPAASGAPAPSVLH